MPQLKPEIICKASQGMHQSADLEDERQREMKELAMDVTGCHIVGCRS